MPLSRNDKLTQPDLVILFSLAVVTLALYARVIGHQFITLDDPTYIEENPMVNRGVTVAGVGWAFTTFYAANWHPLTWISHMIDCQFFGTNAGRHLLINALIHVGNTLLVFWFLLRTTGARWRSALIAALFAIHPLHVESVAWASERKDTLSTFFALLSLIGYVRYARAPSSARYLWVAFTLVLGLLAKPMLVTLPFVMLLLDYWPLRRFADPTAKGDQRSASRGETAIGIRSLISEKIPLFVLVACSAIITLVAQSSGGALHTVADVSIALRLSNALVSYAKYLLFAFWPHDLAVYYPFAGIAAWQIVAAAFLLIGITTFCFRARETRPYLIVGWLWFVGMLVPVIGLVQVGGQIMADRYFYIPSIGLFIAVVFGFADAAKHWRVPRPLCAAVSAGSLLVLAALTNRQIQLWHDSFTLFEHTLAVTPPNVRIEHNLGIAFGANDRYEEAALHFQNALKIDPDFYDALVALGVTRAHQRQLPEAIDYFERAIRSQSHAPKARVQLAHALWAEKRDQEALEQLDRARELAPKDPLVQADFGLALAVLGRTAEAIEELREALRLNPNNAETHNNLGLALLASGKPRESISEFQSALRLKPQLKGVAGNLRRAQAQLGSAK
jgi:tetratricopeptide (TPR) repeat protein